MRVILWVARQAARLLCKVGIHSYIQTGWAQSHSLLYRVPTWRCWRCPEESMGWR